VLSENIKQHLHRAHDTRYEAPVLTRHQSTHDTEHTIHRTRNQCGYTQQQIGAAKKRTSAASSEVSCCRFELDGLKGRLRPPSPPSSGNPPGGCGTVRLSLTALRSTLSVSSVSPASRWSTESAFSTSERDTGSPSGPDRPGGGWTGSNCSAIAFHLSDFGSCLFLDVSSPRRQHRMQSMTGQPTSGGWAPGLSCSTARTKVSHTTSTPSKHWFKSSCSPPCSAQELTN